MIDSALVRKLGMHGCEQVLNVRWFLEPAAEESTFVVNLFISVAGMQKQYKLPNVYFVLSLQLPLEFKQIRPRSRLQTRKPTSGKILRPG